MGINKDLPWEKYPYRKREIVRNKGSQDFNTKETQERDQFESNSKLSFHGQADISLASNKKNLRKLSIWYQ